MTDIVFETRDRIALITLNRPDSLNAWTTEMQQQLASAVTAYGTDDTVDAIVITGTGERAFCAGQDLAEITDFTSDDVEGWLDNFKIVYDSILSVPKPVVAALNGVAAGSGYQLALICDRRIAHSGVRMGQPEVNSGIPSITGHFLTQYSLGHSRTSDMMLTGRLLGADEAQQAGLIHKLVEQQDVLAAAMEDARELASKPPLAFKLTKQRMRDLMWPGLLEAFEAALVIDQGAWSDGEPQQSAKDFFTARSAKGSEGAE
ncbi:MAG: enoyl-CoA hydratase/isomerase family protein [Leucobacter sp.]|uniref:Enoyl-CoA hydratase n=1 Tax=Agrococcus casei LMG 22410 TaxID=1255656 RepID=A0A1R4GB02_9MICO|nr:enoyl-CoA hydratase/isomerase family protein [Agrococcus casei]SJM65430.1 Enoyl-CoA hydratase [Agrococcus casei LMG 22410]